MITRKLFIVCDMQCNNFGNYFSLVGGLDELKEDETGYEDTSLRWHYPKKYCYVSRYGHGFAYNEAADNLDKDEYTRWILQRFLSPDQFYEVGEAIKYAFLKSGINLDSDRQKLVFGLVKEYIAKHI